MNRGSLLRGRGTTVTRLIVDLNRKLLTNGATHLRDNGHVRFYLRLVLCSHEDVSFNSIYLNVLEGIKQFYLLLWFIKTD